MNDIAAQSDLNSSAGTESTPGQSRLCQEPVPVALKVRRLRCAGEPAPEPLAPIQVVGEDCYLQRSDCRHIAGVRQDLLGDTLLSRPVAQGEGAKRAGLDHSRALDRRTHPAKERVHLLDFAFDRGDPGQVDESLSILRVPGKHLLEGGSRLD